MIVKNLKINLTSILFSLILIGLISNVFAQKRQIRVYHVVVKTDNGKVKGILEKNNRDHLFVEKKNGSHVSIPITQVKKIKVKEYPESYKTITILDSEPSLLDRNLDGTLTQEYLDNSLNIGEEIASGILSIAGLMIYNGLSNTFSNLAKFHIGNSEETYLNTIGKISPFSVYYQASPEYELELLNTLSRGNMNYESKQ